MKAAGIHAQFMNVSFVGSQALANELGPEGRGVAISQVVPFPWNIGAPVVKEYQKALVAETGKENYSFTSLEGFIAAKVLVEGLRRAGRDLTREKLVTALETLQRLRRRRLHRHLHGQRPQRLALRRAHRDRHGRRVRAVGHNRRDASADFMHTPAGFVPAHRLPADLPPTPLAFAFAGAKLVVRGSVDAPAVATLADLDAAGIAGEQPFPRTRSTARPCLAVALDEARVAAGRLRVRRAARVLPQALRRALLALAARAFQIADWDRTHRYCGRCGTRTRFRDDERAVECPSCGLVAYPRVSPAMMALVTRGRDAAARALGALRDGRLLGARRLRRARRDDRGLRRAARCARRSASRSTRSPYFASQSWAFPHSLMIAFTAEYAGGEIRLDDPEIEDARWFAPDALPAAALAGLDRAPPDRRDRRRGSAATQG